MTLSIFKSLKGLFSRPQKTKKIDKKEVLSRFIFEKSHFTASTRRISASAFLPPLNNLQTSVFRKSEMNTSEYSITKSKIGVERGKAVKATALIDVYKVLSEGLEVVPDETNHKWHANIINWPSGGDPESRAHRKELAMSLAKKASLE